MGRLLIRGKIQKPVSLLRNFFRLTWSYPSLALLRESILVVCHINFLSVCCLIWTSIHRSRYVSNTFVSGIFSSTQRGQPAHQLIKVLKLRVCFRLFWTALKKSIQDKLGEFRWVFFSSRGNPTLSDTSEWVLWLVNKVGKGHFEDKETKISRLNHRPKQFMRPRGKAEQKPPVNTISHPVPTNLGHSWFAAS